MTLHHLTTQYVSRRLATGSIATSTASNERKVLARFANFLGKRRISQVGTADVERWMASLAHCAPNTRRTTWGITSGFLSWAVDEGHLKRHPMRGLKAPRVPRAVHRALDHDQASALLAACRDDVDRLVIELGLQLGLRRSEITSLELGDVNLTTREAVVHGKGGHQRTVPLTDRTVQVIRSYLAGRPWITAGPLVRSPWMPWTGVRPDWITLRVGTIAYDAGVKRGPGDGVNAHVLRHTAASDIYRRSRDAKLVQDVLGHQSLAATQIYVRGLDTDRLRDAMEGRDYRSGGNVLRPNFGRRSSDRGQATG